MALPDYQSLMLPLLEIAAEGETSVPITEAKIAERFSLSEEEREEMLPSGKQRVLHNRTHWAKFYLTKAGLIDSPKRGRFVISDAGRDLLDTRPPKIDTRLLMKFPKFREFYMEEAEQTGVEKNINETIQDATKTPEEMVDAAYNLANTNLRMELLERIIKNSPSFFETVIVGLLVAMGYGGSHRNAAAQLGKSGDGGVDGVINEDVLGLDRVYIQAKRYALGLTVGRPDVQAFTGSLVGFGASKGVFVTTSTFSAQAIDFASRIPQRVVLIDGKRLTELMIEHSVGVRLSRTIEFKRLDEDFFTED